jgi:GAF domain
VDAAAGSLQDFGQMDERARDYVRTGQKVLASDLIFSSGGELTDAAVTSLDKAVTSELAARAESIETFESRQNFALVAAAAAAGLVMLLLLPRVQSDPPGLSFLEQSQPVPAAATPSLRGVETSAIGPDGWSAPQRIGEPPPADAASAAGAGAVPAAFPSETDLPSAQPLAPVGPAFDFTAVAALCTELSRVDDTMALPPILERAATLLDAAGIILWIADPDGRELNPVLAQGYPPHLVNRLGTIPRGAENATAAAFRTGMLQTVYADGISNGAIAVPLVTYGGCVGVMAAEVKGDTEKLEANLAAATILAAQLASLVGPPGARNADAKVEAANA